jgi:hypothetical protein
LGGRVFLAVADLLGGDCTTGAIAAPDPSHMTDVASSEKDVPASAASTMAKKHFITLR